MLTIAKEDLKHLGSIRCINGLEAAMDEDLIWIRGLDTISLEGSPIRQLPVKHRFYIDEDRRLFPAGGITPTGVMKEMKWTNLPEFIPVELPVSASPGMITEALNITLIASADTKKGAALITSLADWKAFGETASIVRLQRLKFAVSEKNEVLIIGRPLPALPGREYWLNGNMLIPAGFDLEFPMMASIILQQVPGDGSVILFEEDGSWQSIDNNFFIPATRSAIRMTEIIQRND